MAENDVQENPKPITAFTVVSAAVVGLMRLLPFLLGLGSSWNAAPAGALSLFGGARLGFWSALTVPLVMMAGTDLLIYSLKGWSPFDIWVYASLTISVLLGRLLIHTKSPWKIGVCSVIAAAQFFLLTNFGTWLSMSVRTTDAAEIPPGAAMIQNEMGWPTKYASNAQGLMACYVMGAKFSPPDAPLGYALPMFASNLVFTGVLFGAHAWVSRRRVRGVSVGIKQAGAAS